MYHFPTIFDGAMLSVCMLCAICAMTTVTGSAIGRRNDDVSLQSLVSLVQQQAATIQALHATTQALQARVDVLESTDRAQTNSINKINEQIGKKVAFSAYMSTSPVNIGLTSPFVFDVVVTNVGNAYSQHSGIFIAPFDGLYAFYFIMVNDHDAPTVHAAIVKNGQVLAVGTSDAVGTYNVFDDGSALVTAHLAKGDQVYVKRYDTGTKVFGYRYTNFSGFLISADP